MKKGNPYAVKYVYLIGYSIGEFCNITLMYTMHSAHVGIWGVLECMLTLFVPIFMNKRYFLILTISFLVKYSFVSIVFPKTFAFTFIGFFIILVSIFYILLVFFQSYTKAIYTLYKETKQKQQLAVIGKMAATVGHEIRNPLTSLKGFTQLQQKNSNFFAEEIIHIECNEKQMHYTLVHIIKKVIKETKYGSCINIGTYLISKNHILIYIADERCEISKKKLENSMDIFGVEKASDFGLGLMAVYKIVVVDKGVLI